MVVHDDQRLPELGVEGDPGDDRAVGRVADAPLRLQRLDHAALHGPAQRRAQLPSAVGQDRAAHRGLARVDEDAASNVQQPVVGGRRVAHRRLRALHGHGRWLGLRLGMRLDLRRDDRQRIDAIASEAGASVGAIGEGGGRGGRRGGGGGAGGGGGSGAGVEAGFLSFIRALLLAYVRRFIRLIRRGQLPGQCSAGGAGPLAAAAVAAAVGAAWVACCPTASASASAMGAGDAAPVSSRRLSPQSAIDAAYNNTA